MGMLFCPTKNREEKVEGRKNMQKLEAHENVILNCKVTRDKIKAYIKKLLKNENERKTKAKELLKAGNRDKAKFALNQSKFYKEQIKISEGQLNMIEEQIMRVESAQHQKEAIQVLEEGNKVLKKLNEEVNVERWERIADDMSEMRQQQEEIGNFLKSHNIDETDYEDNLNKELQNLIDEVLPRKNIEIDEKIEEDFPNVPKSRMDVEEEPVEEEAKERVLMEA
jgi:charged multivesicular body protein 6